MAARRLYLYLLPLLGLIVGSQASLAGLRPRGLLLIGENGVKAETYAPFVDAVLESVTPNIEVSAVVIESPEGTSLEDTLGRALVAMSRYDAQDLQYWGVVGHGEGGLAASVLAATAHPRVKMLALFGALGSPSVDLSLKNIYTVLVAGTKDTLYPPEVVLTDLGRYPANSKTVLLEGVSHMDFALGADALVQEIFNGLTFLQYPALQQEGERFLVSDGGGGGGGDGDGGGLPVTVSRDAAGRWIAFEPPAGRARAGVAFYQGAAVPTEAYGGLMKGLASWGYVCVATISPVNDARNSPEAASRVIEEYGDAVGTWFISGHSLGGGQASAWAYARVSNGTRQMDGRGGGGGGGGDAERALSSKLAGVLLFSGSASGYNFTATGTSLPFKQIYGGRDGTPDQDPDRLVYDMLPWVPRGSINASRIEGGSHYGIGYYGYQAPMRTGLLCHETQIALAVNLADDWMRQKLLERERWHNHAIPEQHGLPSWSTAQ